MSLQTANLGIMSSNTFQNLTKAPRSIGFFASRLKSRGSGMNGIDIALIAWERNCGSPTCTPLQKLKMVERIQWECNQWRWNRRSKRTVLSNARRHVIEGLLQLLRAPLQFLQKKLAATNKPNPNAKPLVGLYQYERQNYEQTGKQGTALRASTVHDQQANIHSYNEYVHAFDNLDLADPTDKDVRYLNRTERMQYMTYIEDGLFYTADGSVLDCPPTGYCIYSWPYVVDKYGNLYTLNDVTFGQQVTSARLNHSTFCAGKEVICAGTAAWLDGTLIYLSNLSGHYQPDRNRMHQVAVMLAEEDIDTRLALVEIRTATGLDSFKFNTFAANPGAAPDWTAYKQGAKGTFGVGLPEIKGFVVNNPA